MRIEVRCQCGAECKEWAIVELQGSLEIQNPEQELQSLEIGSLCRTSESKYTFTVGYHELEGQKVPLRKPLLVLGRIKENADEQQEEQQLEVVGVIRHKILFKTRPKALISKPEEKPKKPRCN